MLRQHDKCPQGNNVDASESAGFDQLGGRPGVFGAPGWRWWSPESECKHPLPPLCPARARFPKKQKDTAEKGFCTRLTPNILDPVDHQAPLFLGFPRQEYWSGLPFPSPGDLPDPGIEPTHVSCVSSICRWILYH